MLRLVSSLVLLPLLLGMLATNAVAGQPRVAIVHAPQQYWRAPVVRPAYPPVAYVYRGPARVYAPAHYRPPHRAHRGGHFYGCGYHGHYPAAQARRGSAGLWVDGVWIAIGARHR
jgi:hypothetical protein